jgi:hypothetical protein
MNMASQFHRNHTDWMDGAKQGVLMGVALAALMLPPASPFASFARPAAHQIAAAVHNPGTLTAIARRADFGAEQASDDIRRLANWVVASGDNQRQFFVLVDKKNTHVFVFNADGSLRGATPVLIGAAIGDDSIAGIGSRPIELVAPHERTTPSGRFQGERGRNASGEDVVWVDYDAAVSMHRVRANEPKERRLERLASPQTDDNRISYGCINVPVDFYEALLRPAFAASRGVVYVLPETKALDEVFTALPREADPLQVSALGFRS